MFNIRCKYRWVLLVKQVIKDLELVYTKNLISVLMWGKNNYLRKFKCYFNLKRKRKMLF